MTEVDHTTKSGGSLHLVSSTRITDKIERRLPTRCAPI